MNPHELLEMATQQDYPHSPQHLPLHIKLVANPREPEQQHPSLRLPKPIRVNHRSSPQRIHHPPMVNPHRATIHVLPIPQRISQRSKTK